MSYGFHKKTFFKASEESFFVLFIPFLQKGGKPMVLISAQRDAIEFVISESQKNGKDYSFPRKSLQRERRFYLENAQEIFCLGVSLGASMRGAEFQGINVAVFGFSPPGELPSREKCRKTETVSYAVLLTDECSLCLLRLEKSEGEKVIFEKTAHTSVYHRTIC